MNKILPIILVVVLSGCAAKPMYLESGKLGYSFSCVEASGHCERQASEACGHRGYVIVKDTTASRSSSFIGIFGGGSNTMVIRQILLHCK